MLLAGLVALASLAASAVGQTAPDSPPADCHVTLPSGGRLVPPAPLANDPSVTLSGLGDHQFWFGTSDLWTILPIDGIWRAWQSPSQPGDFAYSNKIPWFSKLADSSQERGLTVTGKRLDGPAPSFTETQEIGMGGISIPVFGCWQVTARYSRHELRFTVWVAPPEADEESSPSSSATPETAQITPRRLFVDAERQAKMLVYKVIPEAPADADVTGSVVLHTVIGADGRPRELQYISGPPPLTQAAMDAVKWWQYRVEMVDDEGVEVDTTIEVTFPPGKS